MSWLTVRGGWVGRWWWWRWGGLFIQFTSLQADIEHKLCMCVQKTALEMLKGCVWRFRAGTKEVVSGSSFNVKSIYYVLTGVSNSCAGSLCCIHNAWVDALLENIHLQKTVRITKGVNPPPPQPNLQTNPHMRLRASSLSSVIHIMDFSSSNCYFWLCICNYRCTSCCSKWRWVSKHLKGAMLCSCSGKLL